MLALQLVEDRAELGLVSDQIVVVEALEPRLAAVEEAVADRVPEEAALRVMASVKAASALALLGRAREH